VGSVSGGCIDDDRVQRAQRGQLPNDRCEVLTFGVTKEEAKRFRLPCGGVIRVVVEPMQSREPIQNRDWLEQVLQLVQAHRLVRRTLNLNSLQVELDNGRPQRNYFL